VTDTNPPPVQDPTNSPLTNVVSFLHAASADDVADLIPQPGDYTLHVVTPTLLELKVINTAATGSTTPSSLNLVDGSYNFLTPSTGLFAVTANGQSVPVQAVGFKRR